MSFISYSQNFEDVMLWRALKGVQDGFYIDAGAHDPTDGSVTKAFYERGWSGINIEPIAAPFELLKAARLRDINLQVCAGAVDGEIDIYDISPSGLATTQVSIAEEYRAAGYPVEVKHVPVQTLSRIFREYVTGEVHFLKIDVEGFEKEVLLGADFSILRPWIIVVEATYPNSPKENYTSWEDIVLNAGYRFAYFDGLNRFYVSIEHEDLLSCFNTPPNYFDEFALSSSCFFSRQVTAELQQAEAEAQQAIERTQQAEAKAEQAEAKAEQAEAKAEQAEAKAEQAEAKAEQAEAKAEQAMRSLQAVTNSRSWRVTAPLRLFGHHAKGLIQHGFIARIKAFISKTVRFVAQHGYAFVNARPNLRLRLTSLAIRLGLYEHIRSLKLRLLGRPPAAPISTRNEGRASEKIDDLTPRTRRIYRELNTAIEEHLKRNN
jgi:FkbM family methyltransferase